VPSLSSCPTSARRSPRPDSSTPSTSTIDLGEALDTLGIRRIQFVLHDLGALIALPWTLANPGRVASVTLIDTGLLPGYKWHPAARIWQAPGLGEIAQGVLTRGLRRIAGNAEPRGLPRSSHEMYEPYRRIRGVRNDPIATSRRSAPTRA
jgi:pimeloyl-ACP methyl ester carboxylesterase